MFSAEWDLPFHDSELDELYCKFNLIVFKIFEVSLFLAIIWDIRKKHDYNDK